MKDLIICERTDCAMNIGVKKIANACDALSEVIEKDCPFFKTNEQMKEELHKLYDRMLADTGFCALCEAKGIYLPKKWEKRKND